jgi:bifunctional non-homologous end joining protein LigD
MTEPPVPMEPVPWPAAFDDPGWLWQIKWDGVRCLAVHDGGGVRLWSRHGHLRTSSYPEVAAEVPRAVGGASAVLDGELVALDGAGRPSFHLALRRALQTRPPAALVARIPLVYMVFDVLAWDGDLRSWPIERRLELLARHLEPTDHVRAVQTAAGGGVALLEEVAAAGLEGAVAKRAGSAYTPGRSPAWRKVKPRREVEAWIVGWNASPGTGRVRSLVLALEADGTWTYIGDVGAGLTETVRRRLREVLERLAAEGVWVPPFPVPPPAAGAVRRWVRPALKARVTFAEWTPAGQLRAPVVTGFAPGRVGGP